jgi:hypothetical protein
MEIPFFNRPGDFFFGTTGLEAWGISRCPSDLVGHMLTGQTLESSQSIPTLFENSYGTQHTCHATSWKIMFQSISLGSILICNRVQYLRFKWSIKKSGSLWIFGASGLLRADPQIIDNLRLLQCDHWLKSHFDPEKSHVFTYKLLI